MPPASEKWSYREELSCKKDSLKENWFFFNENQDTKFQNIRPYVKDLPTHFWTP